MALTATLLGACSTSQTSEVHLVIDADNSVRAQTSSLRVVLAGRARGTTVWEEADPRIFDQSTPEWPRELTFPPKNGDSSREFSVSATAFGADRTELVAQYGVGRFTRGRSEFRVMLTADCLSNLVRCNAEQTCALGQCVDALREADSGVPDAGSHDAGMTDANITDANITDANVVDANIPDANIPDASSADTGVDACIPHAVYRDEDDDGFGVASSRMMTCTEIEGYVESEGDCDDRSGEIRPGTRELCDGFDNNCDGRTDEGCGCVSGTTRACGTEAGECTAGTETCTAGTWTGCTATSPSTETCDGRDNDCNGSPDDGATCAPRPNTTSACTSGACNYTCRANYGDCDVTPSNGCEVTLLTDARNCGRCGNSCRDGTCVAGVCSTTTGTPWCTESSCVISSVGPPSARQSHSGVWTGSEMIVWGGAIASFPADGGRYNPSINAWSPVATSGAPPDRHSHATVWTGSEMIVWGGFDGDYLNDGALYNPSTNVWSSLSSSGAPSVRGYHSAVWTGSEMIVWGGFNNSTGFLGSGARYNPSTNSWAALPITGAPSARYHHSAVWTGSEMIVWGGFADTDMADGARYNPSTNAWSSLSRTGAPSARSDHSAVWTGSEMIVWGGAVADLFPADGARYHPSTNTWAALSTAGAPLGRAEHSTIWTGSEMIVWGGYNGSQLADGARYSPSTNVWSVLSTASTPGARYNHSAVWTGSEMIVWGGSGGGRSRADGWIWSL